MKKTYPIIMTKVIKHIVVYVPDFNINTQGKNEADAIKMARDAIGLIGIDMLEQGEDLPSATPLKQIRVGKKEEIATLVEVDFGNCRRKDTGGEKKK